MSQMHKEYGHFSRPVKRELQRMYKLCPCCGTPSENLDHIFPICALEAMGEKIAAEFGVPDIHSVNNGWHICTVCHAQKSAEEFAAWPNGDKLSEVYNRWFKKAFTATGRRRFWKGEANMAGVRARRNRRLIERRLRAKQKIA